MGAPTSSPPLTCWTWQWQNLKRKPTQVVAWLFICRMMWWRGRGNIVENFKKEKNSHFLFFLITEGKALARRPAWYPRRSKHLSLPPCFHFPTLSNFKLTNSAVTVNLLSRGFCQVPDFHLFLKTSKNCVRTVLIWSVHWDILWNKCCVTRRRRSTNR